ncbi:MAG: S9 family peptidase [Prochlorothrix sp.]
MTPTSAPCGSWSSPITANLIAANSIGLGEALFDGEQLYWVEMRPAEGARNVLCRYDGPESASDLTPAHINVRTRVHEYGGDCCTLHQGIAYFSNFKDQRLYRLVPGQDPQPLTPEGTDLRYANGMIHPQGSTWIGIREDHRGDGEAVNTLVSLDLQAAQTSPQEGRILASGHDFFASPSLSPDGQQLAWLTWDHPQMPWDGTDLCVGTFQADGSLGQIQHIAGGPAESVFQPLWSPDGRLYFVSDRNNWWNLYRWDPQNPVGDGELVYGLEAEFGLPQWVFGMTTYGFRSAQEIICSYTQDGTWFLARLDLSPAQPQLIPLDLPFTEISNIQVSGDRVAFMAGAASQATTLYLLDLSTQALTPIRSSTSLDLDPRYLSQPEPIAFPTTDNLTAYALYYPPTNPDYTPLPGEKPPLLVKSHGGPTAATCVGLNLTIQYWTSRGFGVLDVNYGGSTGYGRAYRERLKGQWGIVDVADCANGARYMVKRGDADGDRLAIDGGSAGGYTTLCALAFTDVFKAGSSRYGVSDLTALAEDTHKFESRYLDSLVGPYPAEKLTYAARSPIHHTDRLNCPVVFFQGLEDKIVPPNQAEMMVEALKKKGIPVAYVPFEGEQHGFRKAENIKRCLEGELWFYGQIFGFTTAESIDPLEVFNLPVTPASVS